MGSSGGGTSTEREPRDPLVGPILAELTSHHVEPVHNLQAHISNGWQRAQGPQSSERAQMVKCSPTVFRIRFLEITRFRFQFRFPAPFAFD